MTVSKKNTCGLLELEVSQVNPCIYGQIIFKKKNMRNTQYVKENFFNKWC